MTVVFSSANATLPTETFAATQETVLINNVEGISSNNTDVLRLLLIQVLTALLTKQDRRPICELLNEQIRCETDTRLKGNKNVQSEQLAKHNDNNATEDDSQYILHIKRLKIELNHSKEELGILKGLEQKNARLEEALERSREEIKILQEQQGQLLNNNTRLEDKMKWELQQKQSHIERLEEELKRITNIQENVTNFLNIVGRQEEKAIQLKEEIQVLSGQVVLLNKIVSRLNEKLEENKPKNKTEVDVHQLSAITKKYGENLEEALIKSTKAGDLTTIKLLLDHGVNISIHDTNFYGGYTPLHWATFYGLVGTAKLLLEYGANPELRTFDWNSTVLHLAAYEGRLDILDILVHKGAKVNARNRIGNTPLHDAAGMGHISETEILVEHGADVTLRNNDGNTPQEWAYRWGQYETSQWLKKRRS